MPVSPVQIAAVSALFNARVDGDPVYELFNVIGPEKVDLAALVDVLKAQTGLSSGTPAMPAIIQHTAVVFSLRVAGNAAGTVSGTLARDHTASGPKPNNFDRAISELLLREPVKLALAAVKVKASHLQQLRSDWIAVAAILVGSAATSTEIDAEADKVVCSIDLGVFLNSVYIIGCKGLSCPATPKLTSR